MCLLVGYYQLLFVVDTNVGDGRGDLDWEWIKPMLEFGENLYLNNVDSSNPGTWRISLIHYRNYYGCYRDYETIL